MNGFVSRLTVGVLISVSMLALSVAPASAVTLKGSGFYINFDGVDGESTDGIVVADRLDGNRPRLFGGIAGLPQYRETDFNFRSIQCSGTPAAANRVFGFSAESDQNGQVFFKRNPSASINFDKIKSLWIDWGDGRACALSLNFTKVELVGDYDGDGAVDVVSRTNSPTPLIIVVVQQLMNDRARVSIVVNGTGGNDEYSIRGANRACGQRPTATHFGVQFSDVLVSPYKSKVVDMTQNQLDSMRSLRIRNITDGTNRCEPLSIIAILIGN